MTQQSQLLSIHTKETELKEIHVSLKESTLKEIIERDTMFNAALFTTARS